MSELYNLVSDKVEAIKAKWLSFASDGKIDFGEGASLLSEAFTAGIDVYSLIKDKGDNAAQVDCLVEAAEKLFDEVIVPYDFENIPDFFEKWIEKAARPYLRPAIEQLFTGFKASVAAPIKE